MYKKHQITLILITLLLHDTIKSQETKNTFSKETKICIKAGTIINGYNKQLYLNLNEGLLAPKYFPDNRHYIS